MIFFAHMMPKLPLEPRFVKIRKEFLRQAMIGVIINASVFILRVSIQRIIHGMFKYDLYSLHSLKRQKKKSRLRRTGANSI